MSESEAGAEGALTPIVETTAETHAHTLESTKDETPVLSDETTAETVAQTVELTVESTVESTAGGVSMARSFLQQRTARERKAGAIMASGVVALLVVQLFVVRPAIERKLIKRANAVLLLNGSKAITVSASGRDLSLAGYAASQDDRSRAIALVKARRGVRVVDGARLAVDPSLAAAGGPLSLDGSAENPAPVPTGDGAGDQGGVDQGGVDQGVGATPGSGDAAQTETAAALNAERAKPMRRAKISARISDGKATIEGTVPSEEGRDQLLGRTRQNLGDQNVTDSLVVPALSEERPDLNDYRRVGQLLSILASFPGAAISLNYDRGTLQISGTVTTANDLALAQGEIRKLVPDETLRVEQLSVGTIPAETSTVATSSTQPAN
jgi:osmotically-inducible protein OsmY